MYYEIKDQENKQEHADEKNWEQNSLYTEVPVKAEKQKKSHKFRKQIAVCASLALVFGTVSSLAFQATDYAGNTFFNSGGSDTKADKAAVDAENETISKVSTSSRQDSSTTSAVASETMPAIVAITNKGVQEVQDMFGQNSRQYQSESSGSGIIVGKNDTELLIATNNHVVADAAQLSICFADDSVYEAQIKGTDVENDLAVVAVKLSDISNETMGKIKIAELGDSGALQVGEQVVAIGNALGYGQSVTSGIVSALDRQVTVDNMTSTLIQTDAAINPGNSGGALLNMQGQVIGINAVKFASSEVEGMGYAIPITTAQPILDDLMNRTTRSKVDGNHSSYLGIGGQDVTSEISQMYNMPAGVYVGQVEEGSPAAKAGLKAGDIITKFDGTSISSMSKLQDLLSYYASGEKVEIIIKVADNGEYKEKKLEVTLGAKESKLEF